MAQTRNIFAPTQYDYYHLDTGNGSGSIGNRIRRFSNIRASSSNGVLSYTDSSTNGATFTAAKKCRVTMTYSDISTTDGALLGISKNASSLTTNVESLTPAEVIGLHHNVVTVPTDLGQVTAVTILEIGDILRPHHDGNFTSVQDKVKFTILAEEVEL